MKKTLLVNAAELGLLTALKRMCKCHSKKYSCNDHEVPCPMECCCHTGGFSYINPKKLLKKINEQISSH